MSSKGRRGLKRKGGRGERGGGKLVQRGRTGNERENKTQEKERRKKKKNKFRKEAKETVTFLLFHLSPRLLLLTLTERFLSLTHLHVLS